MPEEKPSSAPSQDWHRARRDVMLRRKAEYLLRLAELEKHISSHTDAIGDRPEKPPAARERFKQFFAKFRRSSKPSATLSIPPPTPSPSSSRNININLGL